MGLAKQVENLGYISSAFNSYSNPSILFGKPTYSLKNRDLIGSVFLYSVSASNLLY